MYILNYLYLVILYLWTANENNKNNRQAMEEALLKLLRSNILKSKL